MKRWQKILGVVVAVVVVAVFALSLVLDGILTSKAREQAQKLSEEWGRPVQIGSVATKLLTGLGVRVRDVQIGAAPGEGLPLVQLNEVDVKLALLKAAFSAGKEVEIHSAEIRGLTVNLERFPDGTTKENATYDGVEIKQADANLLAYPLDMITDKAQIEKDLHYYEPRFSANGPAMGYAVLATLYARLGDSEKAHSIFVKSYQPNKVPPFGVISETAGGTNPYFATGAGGMLQSVIFGFGGLQITDLGIQQRKIKLPGNWKALELKGIGPNKVDYSVK